MNGKLGKGKNIPVFGVFSGIAALLWTKNKSKIYYSNLGLSALRYTEV